MIKMTELQKNLFPNWKTSLFLIVFFCFVLRWIFVYQLSCRFRIIRPKLPILTTSLQHVWFLAYLLWLRRYIIEIFILPLTVYNFPGNFFARVYIDGQLSPFGIFHQFLLQISQCLLARTQISFKSLHFCSWKKRKKCKFLQTFLRVNKMTNANCSLTH